MHLALFYDAQLARPASANTIWTLSGDRDGEHRVYKWLLRLVLDEGVPKTSLSKSFLTFGGGPPPFACAGISLAIG